jgi:hypothetical protein
MSQSLLNLVAIAVFLMTFSALLAPILPISPFVPVATTFGLLGLVTVDQWSWGGMGTKIIADIFATAEDRDRVLRHEAGHFLAAYYLGIPVTGYTLTAWSAFRQKQSGLGGVQFDLAKLDTEPLDSQQIPLRIERLSIVLMAGIAAETLIDKQAQGGANDRQQLRSLLKSVGFPQSVQAQKERWAILQAQNLLQTHAEIYQSLKIAMADRQSIEACYELLRESES